MERALNGRKRVLGLEHPDTLASLVGIYTGQGRYAETEALRDSASDGVEP